MEILSPAGNSKILRTAVKSGADAVYFGVKNFSARAGADNFTFEEAEESIQSVSYTHLDVYKRQDRYCKGKYKKNT